MFSSLKTAAVISIVLSVVNAIATVLIYMMLSPDTAPTAMIAITAFTASTSVILLINGFALRNLHLDMETTIEAMNSNTVNLRKRIETLEKKN